MSRSLAFLFIPLFLFGQSFLYQLQNLDINETSNSSFDLVVTSYSRDATLDQAYTADDLQQLHDANKTVLSYLSIGEAGSYEYYFDSSWLDVDGNPSSTAPEWLGHLNPDWIGDYKVRYWYDEWFENFLKPYLDRIIDSGFDGIYLDIIDAYEYWADRDNYTNYGGIETLLPNDPIDDENRSALLST